MKIWKTMVWRPMEIACLKWASILFGMICGAYLHGFVRDHLWGFAVAAVVIGAWPAAVYLRRPGLGGE